MVQNSLPKVVAKVGNELLSRVIFCTPGTTFKRCHKDCWSIRSEIEEEMIFGFLRDESSYVFSIAVEDCWSIRSEIDVVIEIKS